MPKGPHVLRSSQLLSMAEAALDLAQPAWRDHPPEVRQLRKDDMMQALFDAMSNDPAKARLEAQGARITGST